ncbi:MAG TPA: phosphatase PAP2 family protein [Gemmatimonadales bacterium]|nr:phosphatase PAP2 family protein [Gemmatimonadales bacterium]
MPLRRLVLILGLLTPATSAAQSADSLASSSGPTRAPRSYGALQSSPPRHLATPIRLWHVGAALGGVALVSLADHEVQRYIVDHRTQGEQDLADKWQQWGEGPIPIAITLGTLGTGLVLRKPEVARTGGRLATSLVAVTLLGRGLKKAIGRARPSEADDQYTFDPFGTYNAFPSGHTITAFAISTVLADAIDNKWADVGLYGLAAGTGVSRLVGNHHWLSDVTGAAILGITTAKVVDGKWRIFGLQAPELLTGPGGAGMRWTLDVPGLRGAPRARN